MRQLLFGLILCFATSGATANFISAPAVPGHGTQNVPTILSDCPDQGGILDSVSVPVGDPLELVVLIPVPAPEGGAQFRLSSDDPSVAAVGDRRQGFLPVVTIPEGETLSNPFTVFGINVGDTLLRATSLTPGFSGFTVPLGAWDVGAQGTSKFLDPNRGGDHCRVDDDSPELSTDEATLANCGTIAQGAVTDGISRLLMRMQSGLPGTACYEIVSTDASDQGSVETSVITTASVGGVEQASSYYRAPDSFEAGGDSRTVEIEFTFTPAIGNGNTTRIRAETTLVRPPVVLVHGVWSDGGAFRGFWTRNDRFHTTYAADYEDSNDHSFSENVANVREYIADAVEESREKGYSTTQADIIGHSMGGLLSRLYTEEQDYVRPDNLDAGDTRRMLTLATPHFGSNFANLVVALHDAEPERTRESIANVVSDDAQVINGGVCDLAENSPALNELAGGTGLPAHLVTATGGPEGTQDEPAEYWGGALFGTVSNFERELTKTECVDRNMFFICTERRDRFPQEIVDGHRFREQNDAIVPLSSARGGLQAGSAATTDFADLIHFGAPTVAGVTNRRVVADHALPLLDETLDADAWAGSFPGVQSDGSGAPLTVPGVPDADDAMIYADQCTGGGPMKPAGTQGSPGLTMPGIASADSRVQVVSPQDGQIFAPGDTVDITVAIESPLSANDIQVRIPGLASVEGIDYDGDTYRAEFIIPEAFAGPITLVPVITDTANERIEGPAITIAARPIEAPDELYLVQRTHRLDLTRSQQAQLRVFGVYPNDLERDLTSAAAGTMYLSSDPDVVTVDDSGRLTPAGLGIAVVVVQHADLITYAMITVREGRTPLPPVEITENLDIDFGGFRLDRGTGFFVQLVRVENNSGLPVHGPLHAAFANLTDGVELINNSGVTRQLSPAGTPYVTLPLATDGLTLMPDEVVMLKLQFLNPDRLGIGYDFEIVHTTLDP